ncbi:unnamed protein product [Rhizoctonia solani]|uniref:SHSP domain-containing protein n=1 Tax=Rhizoctonia solani TaxID=456999 RepID=A0A8H3DHQ6_9AGAM|nr:unnamed protein product [Rhizoctonia solani]
MTVDTVSSSLVSTISGLLIVSNLNCGTDIKDMPFSAPLSPPTNLSPMDITPGGGSDPVVPPTPPTGRSSRPQLTSRLSSRSGGKRHASIGSAREVPFPLPQDASSSGAAPQQNHAPPTDNAPPGWNARLRDMGLHIPGMGSPTSRTPKSPRSGSMSSGGVTPKSPDEQRAASYFSFRRGRTSSGASPGKSRTPPVPPPPPPPPLEDIKRREKEYTMPSPIAEESPSPTGPHSKRTRANLSLDLSSTLASRGSTASLPLMGHTPIEHLLLQDDSQGKPRRVSMVAPMAPPPHVHTPPVHPPSYEYPFLPHHAPRQPLEVRVEENPPGPELEGGSWVISVRQPLEVQVEEIPPDPELEGGSWVISVRLPGFAPDGITVGTRRGRVLMIVADNYNDDDGGEF